MKDRKIKLASFIIYICILTHMLFGCATQFVISQKPIKEEITEIEVHGKCKKYIKNGLTVVYLKGTPYEIGFAHGKLCKTEIKDVHKYYLELYNRLHRDPNDTWLKLSRQLEKNIPEEYIEEMHGIYHEHHFGIAYVFTTDCPLFFHRARLTFG